MDPKTSPATTSPQSPGDRHAAGDALLAVAEGDGDRQPDEATLAHIFSCERCSQNVRDIRSGLAALGIKPGAPRKAAAPAVEPMVATLPTGAADHSPILAPNLAPILAPMLAPAADDVSKRSRALIWKVVLIGAVLGGALFYLRSFATNLH